MSNFYSIHSQIRSTCGCRFWSIMCNLYHLLPNVCKILSFEKINRFWMNIQQDSFLVLKFTSRYYVESYSTVTRQELGLLCIIPKKIYIDLFIWTACTYTSVNTNKRQYSWCQKGTETQQVDLKKK